MIAFKVRNKKSVKRNEYIFEVRGKNKYNFN